MYFINILLYFWIHPFYVSVTTIEQSKDKNAMEITSRIFYDDLEAALKNDFGVKVDLKNAAQSSKNNELIKKYFEKNFLVKINETPVKVEYLGFTLENEAAWCFLEIRNSGSVKKIEVINRILYDSFKEQINIFHVSVNGKKKSTKLQNPENRTFFEF
jgi:hypothetical protein